MDTTPPQILNYTPAQGADVSQSYTMILIFTENVQAGTGNMLLSRTGGGVLTIPSGSTGPPASVGYSAGYVTIKPTAPLAVGIYTFTMPTGVTKDAAGNPFGAFFSGNQLQFTVSAAPPTATPTASPTMAPVLPETMSLNATGVPQALVPLNKETCKVFVVWGVRGTAKLSADLDPSVAESDYKAIYDT